MPCNTYILTSLQKLLAGVYIVIVVVVVVYTYADMHPLATFQCTLKTWPRGANIYTIPGGHF